MTKFLRLLGFLWGVSVSIHAFSHDYYVSHGRFFHPKYSKDFSHFSWANPLAPKGGKITLVAREGNFDSFNPYILKGTPPAGMELLHVSLMRTTPDDSNVAYPYLAESVYVSDDEKSVLFKLREDATFHDGSSITSKDVVFTFDLLKRFGAPRYAIPLEAVKSVVRVDRYTVQFTFTTPSRLLPFILAQLPILSKDFYRSYSFQETNLVPPLGSGPYAIDSFRPGSFISYRRIRDWWGRAIPSVQGQYNFDKVTYRYFESFETIARALAQHKVDHYQQPAISRWLQDSHFSLAPKGGAVIKKDIKNPSSQGLSALFINTRQPFLKDRRIRKALNLLFNFEGLNHQSFSNHCKRNKSIYMDTGFSAEGRPSKQEMALLSGYDKSLYAPEALRNEFHPPVHSTAGVLRLHFEEAVRLVQSAGWVLQKGSLIHPQFGAFKLRFLFSSASEEKQFQDYFATLKQFGVEVRSEILGPTPFLVRVKNFDYDIVMFSIPSFSTPGLEQKNLWTSQAAVLPGSFNLAGIQNHLVDDLVDKIIHAKTLEQLHLYTSLLDRVISWGYYMIPLWNSPLIHVAYRDKFSFIPAAENLSSPYAWWKKKLS